MRVVIITGLTLLSDGFAVCNRGLYANFSPKLSNTW